MITHLRGKLIEKNQSYLIVDCNGIGYHICISSYTHSFLSEKEGKSIWIHTYLVIRENQHILYGFFKKKERKIFSYLISVNGIGPSLAIILLSDLTPDEIEESIYKEDIKIFNNIKGIGIKTAKKIIIELKDKISKEFKKEQNNHNLNTNKNHHLIIKKKALNALKVLGFSYQDSNKIIDEILSKNTNFSVENLVKEFLKKK